LDETPARLTWRAGVDVLCLGGTKNGMAVGEAILFFDRELAGDFAYRCKQAGQLASKMRFIAAPWLGLLETGAWLRNARQANEMATYLEQRLRAISGLRPMFPRQANSVFFELPPFAIQAMRAKGWQFYTFIGVGGVRLMCSWNTTREAVDLYIDDLAHALA
jgi:threonine aldolase